MKCFEKKVPIVFAANDKYIPYLGVALYSLIQHASNHYKYDIYILSADINMHHKLRIQSMERENIHIVFVDVTEHMKDFIIPTVGHLSQETAYRLLVDQFFSEFDKILYLDCDLVVNKDVALLYHEDISGAIVGACRANIIIRHLQYITEELCVPTASYFNAGVLLINIDLFKKYNIGKRGLEMLAEKRYLCQDQDVLNILCQEKVKYLDRRWNVEWEYLTGDGVDLFVDEIRMNYKEDLMNPRIVHYTSPIKPWEYPEYTLAEYFWKYARETVFYEEILKINLKTLNDKVNSFNQFLFPWEGVKPRSKVILYGGGAVGKAYINQIKETKYCTILAVCDTYPEKVKEIILPIITLDKIHLFPFDIIVISIVDEKKACQIKNDLINKGIEETKIYWRNPTSV